MSSISLHCVGGHRGYILVRVVAAAIAFRDYSVVALQQGGLDRSPPSQAAGSDNIVGKTVSVETINNSSIDRFDDLHIHRDDEGHVDMSQQPRQQLEMLCGSLGLQMACDVLVSEAYSTPQRNAKDALKTAKCLPPKKLIFLHVMKTGGMSVDWFLRHACSEHDDAVCSVQRLDFQPNELVQPDQRSCEPSICTLGDPEHQWQNCTGYEKAFTVIREPVDRVWSFYNYLRPMYKPYQKRSLQWILTNYDVDLDAGLDQKDQCKFCHRQLSNAMSEYHFHVKGEMRGSWHVLASLDVVMDVHALPRLPAIAAEKGLFPDHPSLSGHTSLEVPLDNEGSNYVLGRHPNKITYDLIAKHNAEDIKLYTHAKTLPNYIAS